MRSFDAFSDHDFEFFVADLLGTIEGVRYEAFARGADQGVDLRHVGEPPTFLDVVQCKRYVRSTFSHLKTVMKHEADLLDKLAANFRTYRLVTTLDLTAQNKEQLSMILDGYVRGPQDIIAASDLEAMLNANPHIERRHPKLWLSGGNHLQTILNNGTYERSRQILDETQSMLSRYVETNAFDVARQRLRKEKVLIVAGSPGIGKTTLARMLIADAAADGYELIAISADVHEAYESLRPGSRQIFYYDDFLGTTFLQMPLLKNEDKRIAHLIQRVAASDTSLFIMTTREHILQQALETSELLEREGIDARRYLLELNEYTALDRARILYNHIWSSGQLTDRACRSLVASQSYQLILNHKNYNPRLIEHITGLGSHDLEADDLDDYLSFALHILDNPSQIWHHAFERQLDDPQRALLIVLTSSQGEVTLCDLETAFRSYCNVAGIDLHTRLFTRTLKVLDDSFISIVRHNHETFVKPANPSITDFIAQWLRQSPDDIHRTLRGAVFFSQLEWIQRSVLARSAAVPQSFLIEAFHDALPRLIDSPENRWQAARDGTPRHETGYPRVDRALRLCFLSSLLGDDESRCLLPSNWFKDQVDRESSSWAGEAMYNVHLPSVVSLFEALICIGISDDVWRERVKALVQERLDVAGDWEQLARLRRLDFQMFDASEWANLKERFASFASEAVAAGLNYFRDVSELWELDRLGRLMAVSVDRARLSALRKEIHEEEKREEKEAMADVEDPGLSSNEIVDGLRLNDAAQIRALFDHLVQADATERQSSTA